MGSYCPIKLVSFSFKWLFGFIYALLSTKILGNYLLYSDHLLRKKIRCEYKLESHKESEKSGLSSRYRVKHQNLFNKPTCDPIAYQCIILLLCQSLDGEGRDHKVSAELNTTVVLPFC